MKLAVILPAYCAEAYLPECLDSVLNQTFRDFFVIAINDASTDKTGEILEAYAAKDSRLQVFHLPENKGEPFACQFAMDMLKDVEVEYVARMDADDICALDRFEKQIQFLDSHPEIDIVGSQATIFFDDQTGREPVLSDLPLLDKDIKAFLSFAAQNMFNPTTMWRHDSIKNLGINYTATETAPDFHMWVQCALHGKTFANLPEPLLSYRMHTAQESKKRDKINRSVQYTMELWFSHLFPELNPVEVTLLSRILHEKQLRLTTEELKTIFAAYDRISKDRSISLFGEDRNTMFDMIDNFFNFLKNRLKFT